MLGKRKIVKVKRSKPIKKRKVSNQGKPLVQQNPGKVLSNVSFKTTEIKTVDYKDDGTWPLISASGSLFAIRSDNMSEGALSFFHPLTGVGSFNRVGNKVVIKSIRVRCDFWYRKADDSADAQVWSYLIYDAFPNGSTPLFSDIFQMRNQAGVASTLSAAFPNADNADRFKIIKKWKFMLDTQHRQHRIEYFKKVNLLFEAKSNTSDGTQSDIMRGALYFVVQPDGFVPPQDQSDKPVLENICFRVKFSDM